MTERSLRCCLVAMWLVVGLSAQEEEELPTPEQYAAMAASLVPLELGVAPPAPQWGAWRRGAPIELGAVDRPACTVWAFYGLPAALAGPMADGDVDYLVDLQRRFVDRKLRVVAVISDADQPLAAAWAAGSVVVDPGQQTARSWGVMGPGNGYVVVLDGAGRTAFQGDVGAGLVDAIGTVLDDGFDLAAAKLAAQQRRWFAEGFDEVLGQEAQPQVEALLADAPRDGFLWGIAYLIAATKLGDAEAALAVRQRAIAALAAESRPLAVFVDLALRGDPRGVGLASELAAVLKPATVAAPRDPFVQLAWLRALVLADQGREVGRHAARMSKLVHWSAEHSLAFAEILSQAATPPVHRDLVERAVLRAEQLGAAPRSIAAAKYLLLKLCADDAAGAKTLLHAYLGDEPGRITCNNDCWYFLTDLATMGRYDHFAVAIAERMLEQRDSMDYFEFDTAAFAMFLVGRLDDAIELQEAAIQKGGVGNPEYSERLARYRAARVKR